MKKYLIILFALVATVSCKKNSGGGTGEHKELSVGDITHLDLSDAVMLAVRDITNGVQLYKITSSDTVEFVNSMVDGEPLDEDTQIEKIYDLNEKFFYIYYDTLDYNAATYIVDKSSGKAYPYTGEEPGSKAAKSDSQGNVYYIDLSNRLIRLNLSDPSAPVDEIFSFEEDQVDAFAVDDQGNVVYKGWYDGEIIIRSVSASGTKNSLAYNVNQNMLKGIVWSTPGDPFKGVDGGLHYTILQNGDFSVVNIAFNPFGVTYSNSAEEIMMDVSWYWCQKNKNLLTVQHYNRIYILDANNELKSEINNNLWESQEIVHMGANSDFFFVAYKTTSGKFLLKKVDPSNVSSATTLVDSRYETTSFGVMPDNTIYFKALDTEVFTSIIGKISAQGNITTLTSEFSGNTEFIPL